MLDLDHKLAALRELHLHSAVVLGDPAVWTGLAVGAAAALAVALGIARATRRRRSLRREAELALERTRRLPVGERLVEQAKLLRRLARTCGEPASLEQRGEAWLVTLDRLFQTTFFTQGAGRCFARDLYRPPEPGSVPGLTDELRSLLPRLRA